MVRGSDPSQKLKETPFCEKILNLGFDVSIRWRRNEKMTKGFLDGMVQTHFNTSLKVFLNLELSYENKIDCFLN